MGKKEALVSIIVGFLVGAMVAGVLGAVNSFASAAVAAVVVGILLVLSTFVETGFGLYLGIGVVLVAALLQSPPSIAVGVVFIAVLLYQRHLRKQEKSVWDYVRRVWER